jgi:hypothetical protein
LLAAALLVLCFDERERALFGLDTFSFVGEKFVDAIDEGFAFEVFPGDFFELHTIGSAVRVSASRGLRQAREDGGADGNGGTTTSHENFLSWIWLQPFHGRVRRFRRGLPEKVDFDS